MANDYTPIVLIPWPAPIPPYALRLRALARNAGYYLDRAAYHPVTWASMAIPCHPVIMAEDDEQWIRRELRKQGKAPVPPLPRGLEDRYPEHCVHLSAVDGKIAYTPDAIYGRADRQIRIKPGRYLAKYYPEIPAHEASDWVHACAPKAITITQDADEIADVYFNGPPSCEHPESSHANEYSKTREMHPTRVYAGPDLAVAYLGDRHGAIARTVCWPANKTYSKVYGELSLEDRMQALGYIRADPNGARCRVIRDGERIIVPYIDGIGLCEVDTDDGGHEWLYLGRGDLDAHTTRGYGTEEDEYTCSNCGCSIDEDDRYCQSCEDDHWSCDNCGHDSFDPDQRHGESGNWCDDCYGDYVTTCEACGEVLENGETCCTADTTEDGDPTDPTDPPADVITPIPEAIVTPTMFATLTSAYQIGDLVVLTGIGQLGTVEGISPDWIYVAWDQRSGHRQRDGEYLHSIRLATPDDVRAYEMTLIGGSHDTTT